MRLIVCLAFCLLQIFDCTAEEIITGNGISEGYNLTLYSEKRISVKDGILNLTAAVDHDYLMDYGTLTVKLSLDGYEASKAPVLTNITEMNEESINITFNISEYAPYLSQESNVPSTITILANLREDFQDLQVTASLSVKIYPFRYKVTCMTHSSCTEFKPMERTSVVLQITDLQNRNLNDITSLVELNYLEVLKLRKSNEEDVIHQTSGDIRDIYISAMNESSLVEFKVVLPNLERYKDHYHYYEMQLIYKGEMQKIGAIGHL